MNAPKVTVGSDNKGDCQVAVSPAQSLDVSIEAGNKQLVAQGIRVVTCKTAAALGVETASITVDDKGALDYVIAARVEAVLRSAFEEITSPLRQAVERAPSERDRPRRSRLYAPGNNPRFLAGIELHNADCVLLDLEDSVPPTEKAAARVLVKHLLVAVDLPEAWVRINPLDSYGRDDLAEVMSSAPHGICLPKAESADNVVALSQLLTQLERDYGIPEGSTYIMPIIETAKGVLHAEEISAADERVTIVSFGAEDFTRDLGARRTQESLLFARSVIAAAAAAAGVQASDTVYANLEDEEGLVEESKLARDLGFDGKGAINPRQIAAIHKVFSPSADEVEEAQRIVAAAQAAEARGIGAIAIDGKMIDRPILERARRTLKLAEKLTGEESW